MSGGYLRKLAVLLGDIARRGRSGTLRLDAGDESPARLRFAGGLLAGFTPPRTATLPNEHATEAISALRQRVLHAALEAARRDGASPSFEAEDGAAPALPSARGAEERGLNASDLVIDLCRKMENLSWIEDQVRGARDLAFRAAMPPPAVQPSAAVSAVEGFLLSRADGALTVKQVLDTSPLGGPETMRALAALWLVGMLAGPATQAAVVSGGAVAGGAAGTGGGDPGSAAAPPARGARLSDLDRFLKKTEPVAPAPVPTMGAAGSRAGGASGRGPEDTAPIAKKDGETPASSSQSKYTPEQQKERDSLLQKVGETGEQDHYAVLGVEKGADETVIRAAYYRLARLYHPDRLVKPHLEDIHRELEGMFADFTEAYNTLTDPAARAEYDREMSERGGAGRRRDSGIDRHASARDSFLRGRKEMEAGRVFEAMRLFENAVENDPGRPEHYHYLGVCQGQNPRWRKKAEENLRRAIEMNPSSLPSYLELGRLYRKGGLERRSQEAYEQVLQWDPTNKEALAALGRAGPAGAEGSSTGILRSLFKKD